MITKEQYLKSLVHEINVIQHLADKVEVSMLDYRPTEGQRSMLELLQYLGSMFHTSVSAYIAGDQALYMELSKNKDSVTFENFISKMEEQKKFVEEKVSALTEEDMTRESTIWGTTAPLAMQLLGVLKNAVAYKMQLFLYIKSCGKRDINTSNLWAGRDMPKKE